MFPKIPGHIQAESPGELRESLYRMIGMPGCLDAWMPGCRDLPGALGTCKSVHVSKGEPGEQGIGELREIPLVTNQPPRQHNGQQADEYCGRAHVLGAAG